MIGYTLPETSEIDPVLGVVPGLSVVPDKTAVAPILRKTPSSAYALKVTEPVNGALIQPVKKEVTSVELQPLGIAVMLIVVKVAELQVPDVNGKAFEVAISLVDDVVSFLK